MQKCFCQSRVHFRSRSWWCIIRDVGVLCVFRCVPDVFFSSGVKWSARPFLHPQNKQCCIGNLLCTIFYLLIYSCHLVYIWSHRFLSPKARSNKMFVKERRLYFSLHLYLTAYHLYFHITKIVGKRWLFRCIRILRKIYTNTVSIYIASGVKLGSSGGMHPWGNFWEQLPWRKTLEARRENNYNNSTQTSS